MTTHPYDYSGIIAKYWDLLRGDTSQWSSRPYFLKLIEENGQPALDVACGTGRLMLDYMKEGIDIDGVDFAPDMIRVCQQNAEHAGLTANLYVQPMQGLDLPRSYRTIIVPSSSFLYLTDIADARKALQRFYAHLLPGGLLAMSLRVFEPDSEAEMWYIDQEAIRPHDGATVRRWFRCTYDVKKRLQSTEDRYEIIRDGEIFDSQTFVSDPALTWYPLSEALALVEAAGFQNVHAHADFRFEPAWEEDNSYIVLGYRM